MPAEATDVPALEKPWDASPRGFKSHSLRQFLLSVLACEPRPKADSHLVLTRPSPRLLVLGALGNDGVVLLFILSRTVGMPFGPEAFRAERLTTPGIVATACELLLVALACYRAHTFRHEPRAVRSAI